MMKMFIKRNIFLVFITLIFVGFPFLAEAKSNFAGLKIEVTSEIPKALSSTGQGRTLTNLDNIKLKAYSENDVDFRSGLRKYTCRYNNHEKKIGAFYNFNQKMNYSAFYDLETGKNYKYDQNYVNNQKNGVFVGDGANKTSKGGGMGFGYRANICGPLTVAVSSESLQPDLSKYGNAIAEDKKYYGVWQSKTTIKNLEGATIRTGEWETGFKTKIDYRNGEVAYVSFRYKVFADLLPTIEATSKVSEVIQGGRSKLVLHASVVSPDTNDKVTSFNVDYDGNGVIDFTKNNTSTIDQTFEPISPVNPGQVISKKAIFKITTERGKKVTKELSYQLTAPRIVKNTTLKVFANVTPIKININSSGLGNQAKKMVIDWTNNGSFDDTINITGPNTLIEHRYNYWENGSGKTTHKMKVAIQNQDSKTMTTDLAAITLEKDTETFSMIIIPDTQFFVANPCNSKQTSAASCANRNVDGTFEPMMKFFDYEINWIKQKIVAENNKLNIKFVAHVGDLVNKGSDLGEWERGAKKVKELDKIIPYDIAPGSHDITDYSNPKSGYYIDNFKKYFSTSLIKDNYKDNEKWRLHGRDNGHDRYHLMEEGDNKFIIFFIEYCPSDATVAWTKKKLEANSDRRAIIVTHAFTRRRGELAKTGGCHITAKRVEKEGSKFNGGDAILEKIVKPHKNVDFVISGHFSTINYESGAYKMPLSNGRSVTYILADFQAMDRSALGEFKKLTFYPNQDKVTLSNLSPVVANGGKTAIEQALRRTVIPGGFAINEILDFEKDSAGQNIRVTIPYNMSPVD